MTSIKLLICGDRNWTNYELVRSSIIVLMGKYNIEQIIEGGAPGADTCGKMAGESLGIEVKTFPAYWEKYGRSAGPIRNNQMLKEGNPDIVLAFHNDLTKSKGTKNMVDISRKAGKIVYVISETKKASTVF